MNEEQKIKTAISPRDHLPNDLQKEQVVLLNILRINVIPDKNLFHRSTKTLN